MDPEDAAEPDMVIVGYALLFGELMDADARAELQRIGDAPDGVWAAIFIHERDGAGVRRKWTLFSADRHYARMLAAEAGRVAVPREILRDRFPAFQAGWVIDLDPD